MNEPVWVMDETVQAIHRLQIAEHGGGEGIRDANLLESALFRPRHMFSYAVDTPALGRLAAAYAYGIARNHPFVDQQTHRICRVLIVFTAQRHRNHSLPRRKISGFPGVGGRGLERS